MSPFPNRDALFRNASHQGPLLLGVVHLLPLPGAPRHHGELKTALDAARRDAEALAEGGCDALIVENFGDVPFFPGAVPPETVAGMALAVSAVRELVGGMPVGVNVLRNDARAALGLCAVTGASFLRVNVHSGAAVTDQGIVQGDAARVVRERERLCPDVAILADVHVKHASPLGSESPAEAAADALQRALADAVIITGIGTGRPPAGEMLSRVRRHIGPGRLLVGSGVTDGNAERLLVAADGAIVGSWFKRGGVFAEPVDLERVRRLRELFDSLPRRSPDPHS